MKLNVVAASLLRRHGMFFSEYNSAKMIVSRNCATSLLFEDLE